MLRRSFAGEKSINIDMGDAKRDKLLNSLGFTQTSKNIGTPTFRQGKKEKKNFLLDHDINDYASQTKIEDFDSWRSTNFVNSVKNCDISSEPKATSTTGAGSSPLRNVSANPNDDTSLMLQKSAELEGSNTSMVDNENDNDNQLSD